MKRWKSRLVTGAAVAVLKLTAARELRAEPEESLPRGGGETAPRLKLSLGARFGVSTAPFYTANFPSVRGHGFVFVLSGSYPLGAREEIGLTLPAGFLSVEQPAGAYVDEVTWGNPTVSVTHHRVSNVGDGRALRWFGRIGVSLPLAEHGEPGALLANRALAIASAVEGWREQESYVPGRLSVTPSAGLEFSTPPWKFDAGLKLPLVLEVSDANLPEDADAHAFGFTPVLHSGVDVKVAKWLIPSLNADLVINAVPPVDGAREKIEAAQLVLRPALTFPLSRRALLSADVLSPIAGSLGGSTFSGSLLLRTLW
jgi:hypothetical protein